MAKLEDRSLAEARAELERALARWRDAVGTLPEAETDSGLPVAGVYTPLDAGEGVAELPGEYPYTRGIHPSMYRGRLWTMRLYAGWGGPEDTNARFRYLLEQGQTGLSVALDLPTQMGLDSDHPLAAGEVGKVGVAVDSLADLERVFEGIPLDRVSTSFTVNATAPILLAMYQVVGERQGVAPAELRGTVQNDVLKEFLARKTYIYPPGPSLRLAAELIDYSCRNLPRLNPISVCGYHMRQAGCDAVQEIAFTLANASAYVRAVVERGLAVDEFAPRFSVNVSTMRDFFEEIAKHRASRRLWARIMRERFGARDPRSWTLRLFSGGDGTTLTGAEPLNNIARTTLQTLAIVLSGAQAVHTMSYDEALALPSEAAALVALRTQQIVAYESGAARTADPLGGSYYVEALTDELERRAAALLDEVEREGVLRGIEDGSLELAIAEAAYRQELAIESGERVVVGVNRFRDESAGAQEVAVLTVPDSVGARQLERLAAVRASREAGRVEAALAAVREAAASGETTMPATLEAVRAYATVGEIAGALGDVFGYHEPSTVV
ncbi:MAG: methylmalonyl-CoA mutase [Thermoleophilia bacterium]|nr:methylmalonyl-CoA mutase [Thermoleophilia bacterium]